jgi:hypothetical protein
LWRSRPSCRRWDGNWRQFRRISDQVVPMEEFLERWRIFSKLDSEGSIKELWRNLKSEWLGKQSSPDQFNVHFSSVAAEVRPQVVIFRGLPLGVWRRTRFLLLL